MKILLCHNSYKFRGGEDQVFEDECWLLESHGCEVVTYQRSNSDIDRVSSVETAMNTFWNRRTYRELEAVISREKPAVAHFHNTFPIISPSAYYAARRQGVPVVQTLHNYRLLCPKSVLLRDGAVCQSCVGKSFAWPAVRYGCYKDSRPATLTTAAMLFAHWRLGTWQSVVTRYIALTDFSKRTLASGGIPAERIRIKPNFVRPDPGYGPGTGDYAIYVGRLSPEKGIEVLLDAWRREKPSLPLWVVGEGPMEARVRHAQETGQNIRWLGFRSHADVLALIADAKLLVFPSIWHETFGRSVIEAFATGTPVVATNMAPMNELIRDRETGLLFERGDSRELARQVSMLAEDEALRQSLRMASRREYERRYGAETNYGQLMAIYEEAIAIAGRRGASQDSSFTSTAQVVHSIGQTDGS